MTTEHYDNDDEGDAYIGLVMLNVATEDEARAMLAIWSRRDRLTPEQIDRVVHRAVGSVVNHAKTEDLRRQHRC